MCPFLFFFFHNKRILFVFFFFSSRRRHTRLQGDWSSDVCSSDLRRLAMVDAGKQQRRSTLENRQRRAPQKIREARVDGVLAAADGKNETGIGIELHAEARRTALAAEAGKHSLKKRPASRNRRNIASHSGQFLRLTGGGATFFFAFSASFMASRVPSMASSRLSL